MATPPPSHAKPRHDGRRSTTATPSAHSAKPVANTASLEAWWYSVASPGYASITTATTSAVSRPNWSPAAAHARIVTA